MSTDLAELYQEVIIDHARRPRNSGALDRPTCTVEGLNPFCGDQLVLYLEITDGVIADVAFKGTGCAISQASASLMTAALRGLTAPDALALFERVHTMLTIAPDGDGPPPDVGKLAVLSGVWQYPSRIKCASLAWQTLRSALTGGGCRARTE